MTSVTAVSAESHASAPLKPARRYAEPLIFIAFASLYLLPLMRYALPGTDEGTLLYGGVRVVHGQVFARDFFEVIGPGTFYLLAAFFKLFGVTFLATRIDLFLTSLGTGILIYFLSRRICGRFQFLPCVLMVGAYFGAIWPAISHHGDSNFFALLSFTCIIIWHDHRKPILLAAAGALAGATTWFIQPKGVLLMIAILVWLGIERWRGRVSLTSLATLIAGYLGVVATVLVYFWSQGALWDLIYTNFIWPSQHYGEVNNVPYGQGLFLSYWDAWIAAGSGHYWTIAIAIVLIIPLLFVAALPGILLALAALHRRRILSPTILLYCLCGSALWLSEFHRRDIYHLVIGSPLLIVLCVHLLTETRMKLSSGALKVLAISSACLAGFNFVLTLYAHPTPTRVGTVAMFQPDPVLKYLNEHVGRGEEMFAYPYCPMYYFLTATTNPTPYSFLKYNYNTPSQYQEAIHILDERKVKYVLWDLRFEKTAVAKLFPSKPQPAGDYLMELYLESRYKVVWAWGDVRMMERKN